MNDKKKATYSNTQNNMNDTRKAIILSNNHNDKGCAHKIDKDDGNTQPKNNTNNNNNVPNKNNNRTKA